MKQLELIEFECEVNGFKIKEGDVVMVNYGHYTSIHKVIVIDGEACVKSHSHHGNNARLKNINKEWGGVSKLTKKDVYLFCKQNQWDTEKYLKLFR